MLVPHVHGALWGPALLEPRTRMTRVVVTDNTGTFAWSADRDAYCTATATPDGELTLHVHHSPPATMVGATDCTVLPADGANHDCVRLAPADRPLLQPCAVVESMPELLANGIADAPTDLATWDLDELQLEIVRALRHGPGAVTDRLPLVPADRRHAMNVPREARSAGALEGTEAPQ